MHDSVRDGVADYLELFEGKVHWMYPDSLGLVSTGIGTLLDPFDKFWKGLPFYDKSSQKAATRDEIKAEFDKVKAASKDLARIKDYTKRMKALEDLTQLRITDQNIYLRKQQDVGDRDTYITGLFGRKEYDKWPADAQLAVISVTYGAGSLINHPRLQAACREKDWWGARLQGSLSNKAQGEAGYTKRNAGTKILFQNAYVVDKCRELGKKPFDDVSKLWGLKQALSFRSWQTDPAGSAPDVTKNDVVLAGNVTNWVMNR